MKILLKLIIPSISCFPFFMAYQAIGSDIKSSQIAQAEIGLSRSNPIMIKGIKSIDQIKEAQQDYINKNYPDYHIIGEIFSLNNKGDRFFHILSLRNEDGDKKLIYFDMTDVYKKLKKSGNRKVKKEIQEIEDLYGFSSKEKRND